MSREGGRAIGLGLRLLLSFAQTACEALGAQGTYLFCAGVVGVVGVAGDALAPEGPAIHCPAITTGLTCVTWGFGVRVSSDLRRFRGWGVSPVSGEKLAEATYYPGADSSGRKGGKATAPRFART